MQHTEAARPSRARTVTFDVVNPTTSAQPPRRRLSDRAGLNLSLITLADVLVDIGRIDEARPVLDESLVLCLELEDRTMLAYLLEDLAGVHAAQGRSDEALRSVGYASALREQIGAPLPPNEQARVDRMLAPAYAALGPDAAEAVAQGRALGARQAIDVLLDPSPPTT